MYDKIVGPDTVNTKITHAYIFTMPKSGSAFIGIFLNAYSDLINTKYPTSKDLEHKIPDKHLFGKSDFSVEHSDCPGYLEAEQDPSMLALWKSLSYSHPVLAGDPIKKKLLSVPMAPAAGKNLGGNDKKFLDKTKIVFIYRNPLDQMISFFKHNQRYLPDNHPQAPKSIPKASLEKFIFNMSALEDYIKIFYSFHVIRQKYPNMILFVPYEEIINNKPVALRRIINHLGIPYKEKAFLTAMDLTSIENMKALENKMGHTLLNSKQQTPERHIRNGGIGVWQTQMTPEMVQRIESFFNKFSLSLTMFHLANKLDSEFNFLNPKTTAKPKNRP